MPLALLALAIGAFGIGTTEFVIMGLLPEVAGDFGVSIPTAGFLVTGYALGVMFGALAVVLALFTLNAHNKILAAVTIALIGALGFATVPPLQKRVLDQAHGAPTLASAVNIGAFNLGNALSAWLGGLVIGAGLGYTAPNWVGAILAAAALGLAILSAALERRASAPSTVVTGAAPAEQRIAAHH